MRTLLAAALVAATALAAPASATGRLARSTASTPAAATPPFSHEAEAGREPCDMPVKLFGLPIGHYDFTVILPSWTPVRDRGVTVLEGTCVEDYPRHKGPRVSDSDLPLVHYSHDVCFDVEPDATPDGRFTRLLGVQEPGDGHDRQQRRIEVEWESGVGAGNDGNPLAAANRRGRSGGFFSAGHERGQAFWAWPTLDDWVHVEGLWVWDRGHPPAKTEIHPPRLVATRRALPELIDRRLGPVAGEPGDPVFATRVDVFASGDTGALHNNRQGVPRWVRPVRMGAQDYAFDVTPIVPRPSAGAVLRAIAVPRPGDSFPAALTAETTAGGRLHVVVPWRSLGVVDTAVFARSYYVFWDTPARGAPPAWRPQRVRVTLDAVEVLKTQDPFDDPGELRLFADVGGTWWSLNEAVPAADVLAGGLGHARVGDAWPLARSVELWVPPGGRYRVAAHGWEADGVDARMGQLFDPEQPCSMDLYQTFEATMFRPDVARQGLLDDPLGDVAERWDASSGFGQGPHAPLAAGERHVDLLPGFDHEPDGTFRLRYHVAL